MGLVDTSKKLTCFQVHTNNTLLVVCSASACPTYDTTGDNLLDGAVSLAPRGKLLGPMRSDGDGLTQGLEQREELRSTCSSNFTSSVADGPDSSEVEANS